MHLSLKAYLVNLRLYIYIYPRTEEINRTITFYRRVGSAFILSLTTFVSCERFCFLENTARYKP